MSYSCETEQEATLKAYKLKDKMTTLGWKIRVWENMGWHYDLQRHGLTLSESDYGRKKHYSCLLGDGTGGGRGYWLDEGTYTNPNDAVEGQFEAARKFIEGCKKEVWKSYGKYHGEE